MNKSSFSCNDNNNNNYKKSCKPDSICTGVNNYCSGYLIGVPGPTGPAGGPTGATGATGTTGPAGSISDFADFYALMPPDNAATVALGTDVSFPQDGPNSGTGISRVSASSFNLSEIGTYYISFQVSVTEADSYN